MSTCLQVYMSTLLKQDRRCAKRITTRSMVQASLDRRRCCQLLSQELLQLLADVLLYGSSFYLTVEEVIGAVFDASVTSAIGLATAHVF